MSNIIYPFQIPIYQSFIEENSFIQIKKFTELFIKNNPESFKLVWDCPTLTTQSTESNTTKSLFQNDILKKQIQSHVSNYFNEWDFSRAGTAYIKNLWVNIAPKGAYQEIHNHGKNHFSGCLYINVNEHSGPFHLINPLSSESILLECSNTFKFDNTIHPLNSMILLFPSWMHHRVSQNKSDIDRVTISFNIEIQF
jgi:uncharacterized protein (TIGR02466 family)